MRGVDRWGLRIVVAGLSVCVGATMVVSGTTRRAEDRLRRKLDGLEDALRAEREKNAEAADALHKQSQLADIALENARALEKNLRAERDNAQARAATFACINNLRQIDAAKEMWALANRKVNGDAVVDAEVDQYLVGGGPRCPAGGTYTYGRIGEDPTCSLKDHRLPR
jgi:hypothetical protein